MSNTKRVNFFETQCSVVGINVLFCRSVPDQLDLYSTITPLPDRYSTIHEWKRSGTSHVDRSSLVGEFDFNSPTVPIRSTRPSRSTKFPDQTRPSLNELYTACSRPCPCPST